MKHGQTFIANFTTVDARILTYSDDTTNILRNIFYGKAKEVFFAGLGIIYNEKISLKMSRADFSNIFKLVSYLKYNYVLNINRNLSLLFRLCYF